MGEMNVKEQIYEAYKLDWMISHGYALTDWADGKLDNECFVSYNEFLNNEFKDDGYMRQLIKRMPDDKSVLMAYLNENRPPAVYYDKDLNIDGTAAELLDWGFRYSEDYTDEALEEIVRIAENEISMGKNEGYSKTEVKLIEYELEARKAVEIYGHIGYDGFAIAKQDIIRDITATPIEITNIQVSEDDTERRLEVEVRKEDDKVLLVVSDKSGEPIASNAFTVEDFLDIPPEDYAHTLNETLFYSYQYENDNKENVEMDL